MRQTPVNDYLEEISTELPEELYGNLSDAVYETVCDFDEEVAQLKAENAKLREELADTPKCEACEAMLDCDECLRADGSHKERRRLSAENAKLRERIHWLKRGDILHVLTDQEYIDQCEREREMQASIDALDKDNAKLRELCKTVIDDWMSKVCPTFPFCECGGEYESCADDTCGNQLYRQMLRELGEGVDG